MNFTIRTAKSSDIKEIMKVEEASFIPEIQEEEKLFLERIQVFEKGFLLFIEEETGKIAGYFSTELWNSVPDSPSSFKIGHSIKAVHSDTGKNLYISSFAILPEYRGSGNGKRLFSMAIDYLKNAYSLEKFVLMVNEVWGGARHIYSDYGFKEVFNIKNIFPAENNNSTDGVVMVM